MIIIISSIARLSGADGRGPLTLVAAVGGRVT